MRLASLGAAVVGALLVVTSTLILRNVSTPEMGPSRSDAFWSHFTLTGVEARHSDSLVEMADASELIIVGRMESIELSRSWDAVPEWGDDGTANYVVSDIRVEEVVRKTPSLAAGDIVRLEIFVPSSDALRVALTTSLPTERTLFFLRAQQDVPGVYMLVSSQGYIRDLGKAAAPFAADDRWQIELSSKNFDEIAAKIMG